MDVIFIFDRGVVMKARRSNGRREAIVYRKRGEAIVKAYSPRILFFTAEACRGAGRGETVSEIYKQML